jgi:hypothetical protein
MILLQSVAEIRAIAMPHNCAQHRADRGGVTVIPTRGEPVGRDADDHLRRRKERLRGGHVADFGETRICAVVDWLQASEAVHISCGL